MLLARPAPVLPHRSRLLAPWRQAALAAAALALFALSMWSLGRPLLCPCGVVLLWAPQHDSQHLSDWYSLLHVSFGLGLYQIVHRFQPSWPAATQALVALLGSLAWEAIENLPAVIAMFDTPGASPGYSGDTILNALGDTLFVIAGFALAAAVRSRGSLGVFVAIELAVWIAIRDGLIVGTGRLIMG